MKVNNKAFTIIELLIILAIISLTIIFSLTISKNTAQNNNLVINSREVKDLIILAKTLSINESEPYKIEIYENKMVLKESKYSGDTVSELYYGRGVKLEYSNNQIIYFSRNGLTNYNQIILKTNSKRAVIQTRIGSSKVEIDYIKN